MFKSAFHGDSFPSWLAVADTMKVIDRHVIASASVLSFNLVSLVSISFVYIKKVYLKKSRPNIFSVLWNDPRSNHCLKELHGGKCINQTALNI